MNSLASVATADQATSPAPLPVLITSSCAALSLCTRSFHSHRRAGHRRLVSPRGHVDLAFESPASIVPWPGGVPASALAPAHTLAPASALLQPHIAAPGCRQFWWRLVLFLFTSPRPPSIWAASGCCMEEGGSLRSALAGGVGEMGGEGGRW
jgi:hypothetical protein